MSIDYYFAVAILALSNVFWFWYIAIKQPKDVRRAQMKRRMRELGCYKPCNTEPCKCHGGGKWGRLF